MFLLCFESGLICSLRGGLVAAGDNKVHLADYPATAGHGLSGGYPPHGFGALWRAADARGQSLTPLCHPADVITRLLQGCRLSAGHVL